MGLNFGRPQYLFFRKNITKGSKIIGENALTPTNDFANIIFAPFVWCVQLCMAGEKVIDKETVI